MGSLAAFGGIVASFFLAIGCKAPEKQPDPPMSPSERDAVTQQILNRVRESERDKDPLQAPRSSDPPAAGRVRMISPTGSITDVADENVEAFTSRGFRRQSPTEAAAASCPDIYMLSPSMDDAIKVPSCEAGPMRSEGWIPKRPTDVVTMVRPDGSSLNATVEDGVSLRKLGYRFETNEQRFERQMHK